MITEREFLERARLDRRTLTVWIEEEWLIPARTADELAFTDMDLARANLIRDLKDNMGVNHEGLGVVLHLLDQMHALRRALAAALESAHDGRPSSEPLRSRVASRGRREAQICGPICQLKCSALKMWLCRLAIHWRPEAVRLRYFIPCSRCVETVFQ